MIDEQELQKALDELDTHIRTVKAYMRGLEDKLNELTIAAATPTPKLPEELGWYLTQQHQLLLRDDDGDWAAFDEFGNRKRYYWTDRNASGYAVTPQEVYDKLDPDAFPLVPLSEVILPSEHIKEDEEN